MKGTLWSGFVFVSALLIPSARAEQIPVASATSVGLTWNSGSPMSLIDGDTSTHAEVMMEPGISGYIEFDLGGQYLWDGYKVYNDTDGDAFTLRVYVIAGWLGSSHQDGGIVQGAIWAPNEYEYMFNVQSGPINRVVLTPVVGNSDSEPRRFKMREIVLYGEPNTSSVEPTTWGRIKALYEGN